MNQIISLIMIVLAVSCTAIFADMVKPMLGFKEKNLIYVDGFLDKTELSKNVFIGHPFSGKWHKHWTRYTYVYRVEGRQYHIHGGAPGQRKDIPPKVTVAVQKNAPKNAMIPQFEKTPSQFGLSVLLAGIVVMYIVGIALWYT